MSPDHNFALRIFWMVQMRVISEAMLGCEPMNVTAAPLREVHVRHEARSVVLWVASSDSASAASGLVTAAAVMPP